MIDIENTNTVNHTPLSHNNTEEANLPDSEDENDVVPNTGTNSSAEQSSESQRISSRSNKGIPHPRLINEIDLIQHCNFVKLNGEPSTRNQAILCDKREFWLNAMDSEMKSIHDNET